MVLCTYNSRTVGKEGSLGLAGHLPKCDHQVSEPYETPYKTQGLMKHLF